jgi:hypothetical protein
MILLDRIDGLKLKGSNPNEGTDRIEPLCCLVAGSVKSDSNFASAHGLFEAASSDVTISQRLWHKDRNLSERSRDNKIM